MSVTRQPTVESTGTVTETLAAPARVRLPAVDFERLSFVEIRDRKNRQLVTAIELLSFSNKYAGPDREQYLGKRGQILNSPAHFVEVDLLRRLPATCIVGLPASAVREEAGQAYVFTIEDGKVARRPVALGLREEGYVQVRSGLEQGLPVVRARITDLKPGTAAILKTSAAAARGAGSV